MHTYLRNFLLLTVILALQLKKAQASTHFSLQDTSKNDKIWKIFVMNKERANIPKVTVRFLNHSGSTDENGMIKVAGMKPNIRISFSAVGHQPKQMLWSEILKNKGEVILEAIDNLLDNVDVVSNGYTTIRKEQSTGATSTITTKAYESRISTNVLQGLQNRLPGVLINNNIEYKGNPLFQIRGIATLTAQSSPLIVVDGYPTELKLDAINPNEIESITLLRDAASAAIYGVRAANGVILIQRKRAQKGKPVFSFRTTIGATPKENYNTYRYDPVSTNIDLLKTRFGTPNPSNANFYKNRYIQPAPITPVNDILYQHFLGRITNNQFNSKMDSLSNYNNASEYSKYFQRTALTQQYNFDMSGGNDNGTYFVSAGYLNNASNNIRTGTENFILSSRAAYKISDRISADLNLDVSQNVSKSVPVRSFSSFYPYEKFADNQGNPLATNAASNTNSYYNARQLNSGRGFLDNMYYPLEEVNLVNDISKTFNNKILANLYYKFNPNLKFKLGGIYERSNMNFRHLADENSAEARQLVNAYITENPNDLSLIYNVPKGGILKKSIGDNTGITIRGQLDYNKKFNSKHELNAIVGTEFRKIINTLSTSSAFGYNDQSLLQQIPNYQLTTNQMYFTYLYPYNPRPLASSDNIANEIYTEDRFVSFFGNLVYTYLDRYTLSSSVRLDQTNLFGTDPRYRYKPLWSLGFVWNAKKEKLLTNLDWLDEARLRVSYGHNGNISKNSIPQIIGIYNMNRNTRPISTEIGLGSYENNSLRWEDTRNINIGINLGFLNNRLHFTADYYDKTTSDVLGSTSIDPTKGGTSVVLNSAKISNKGLEFNLNADWIHHPQTNFNWNTGLVISGNFNKVLDVYFSGSDVSYSYLVNNPNFEGQNPYIKGYPLAPIFAYRYAGLNANGNPLIYDTKGNKKQLNFYANDEGLNDLNYYGNGIPTINMGLSNRIDFGRFYIFTMIDYYGGFKVLAPMPDPSRGRPYKGSSNFFKKAGDELHTDVMGIPSEYMGYLESSATYTSVDKQVVNGDYFVLRDVTVSYNLKDRLAKKIAMNSIEIKFQASNIYTVALNRYNYSMALGSFDRTRMVPTFTIGLFTTF